MSEVSDFVDPGAVWVHGGAVGFDAQVAKIARKSSSESSARITRLIKKTRYMCGTTKS